MPNAEGAWVQVEVTGAASDPHAVGAAAAAALRAAGITPPA